MSTKPASTTAPARRSTRTGALRAGKSPVAPGSTPPVAGQVLPLPHERDQGVDSVDATPREVIKQAKHDLDAGQVDTDMRSTPGLDAGRRRRLVPGPGGRGP